MTALSTLQALPPLDPAGEGQEPIAQTLYKQVSAFLDIKTPAPEVRSAVTRALKAAMVNKDGSTNMPNKDIVFKMLLGEGRGPYVFDALSRPRVDPVRDASDLTMHERRLLEIVEDVFLTPVNHDRGFSRLNIGQQATLATTLDVFGKIERTQAGRLTSGAGGMSAPELDGIY